jgi:hypothetical protein
MRACRRPCVRVTAACWCCYCDGGVVAFVSRSRGPSLTILHSTLAHRSSHRRLHHRFPFVTQQQRTTAGTDNNNDDDDDDNGGGGDDDGGGGDDDDDDDDDDIIIVNNNNNNN